MIAALERTTRDQRRDGKRHATVLLIGRVRRNGSDAACLVHDISSHGLMARFTVGPSVGETLHLEIRGLPEIEAVVRWVRGGKAGVEFTAPQDIDRVFCRRDESGIVARPPRFAIRATAALSLGGRRVAVDLLDISPGGAKLRADCSVDRGQAGWIMLPDMPASVSGSICWTREDRFGFRFATPLALSALSRILRA